MDKEYYKEYRKKNLEKIRKTAREWARKNRPPYKWNESRKITQQKYREKHKEEIAIRRNARLNERLKTDINFKIKWLLRSRTQIAIKRNLTSKAYKTIELLGGTIQQAREHIEKQFKEGMTWENHGAWEIDHIIPISTFDLTKPEEQKKAFNYKNLQPLMKDENRSKGAKILKMKI